MAARLQQGTDIDREKHLKEDWVYLGGKRSEVMDLLYIECS
jgi:hypothetical protein